MDFAFRKMFYEEHKSLYLSENTLSPIKKILWEYMHTNIQTLACAHGKKGGSIARFKIQNCVSQISKH